MAYLYHLFLKTASSYSSTALSAEGICEEENGNNEYGKHAVTIIFDSFHSNKVVGQVSLYWSELVSRICVVVTDKIVSSGIGLELETPFD